MEIKFTEDELLDALFEYAARQGLAPSGNYFSKVTFNVQRRGEKITAIAVALDLSAPESARPAITLVKQ